MLNKPKLLTTDVKRKISMIVIILVLLTGIIYTKTKNKIELPKNSVTINTATNQSSVIQNTTQTLRANNSSFNYITQMLEKIKFKYQILNVQNSNSTIGTDIETIENELIKNKTLIENDENAFNDTVQALEKIDSSINLAFYDLGIELIDGNFQTVEFKITSIEENIIFCENDENKYEINSEELPFEMDFAVGDMVKAYYSKLYFEDNVGKISVFFIEKL